MPACHHDHKKADIWTNLGTVGEGAVSAISNFYWGMSLANLMDSNAEDDDRLSTASISVGLAFSILALGAMYAHRKLNTFHQPATQQAVEATDAEHLPEHVITITADSDSPPPLMHDHAHCSHHSHAPIMPAQNDLQHPFLEEEKQSDQVEDQGGKLSTLQKAALVSDFFTHTGDMSGGLALGVDLIANQVVGVKIPYLAKVLTRCSLTLFGMAGSVANVRSCKDAIVQQNEHEDMHAHTAAARV
jgi:hypothetical protein